MSRFASGLVAAYGAYLLYAYWTGALYFYIHPVYMVPTVITGIVLLALAGSTLAGSGDPDHAHGAVSNYSTAPGRTLAASFRLALLILPVALGFLLTPQPLSPLTATQRGVDTGLLGVVEPTSDFTVGSRPEAYTIKDWVKALHADPEPGRHAGKLVRVVGFVHRDDTLPAGWFLVARFVVKCCAVDAQPVGLPVRASGPVPDRGRWVAVAGAWEVAEVAGQRRAVIGATTITPTERPEQPYLY